MTEVKDKDWCAKWENAQIRKAYSVLTACLKVLRQNYRAQRKKSIKDIKATSQFVDIISSLVVAIVGTNLVISLPNVISTPPLLESKTHAQFHM